MCATPSRLTRAPACCCAPQVCDQPHPLTVKRVIGSCLTGDVDGACATVAGLFRDGYSAHDVIGTVFRVTRTYEMPEPMKLAYLKVCVVEWSWVCARAHMHSRTRPQEIGFAHMRIADGVATPLQLMGLVSRLCCVSQGRPLDDAPPL